MTLTESNMLPLGTKLPFFELEVVPGTGFSLDTGELSPVKIKSLDLSIKPVLLMLLCTHCPFVRHIEVEISRLTNDYGELIQFLGIASNSLITHPQDGPKELAQQARNRDWRFPYLLDQDQSLAKDLQAACTPDFFLFAPMENGEQQLKYRGQLDSSRPSNNFPSNGEDLRSALDLVINGKTVFSNQKPSIGCNIKWHPGQEPLWFSHPS